MPRDRLGSWQELDPWLEVAAGREGNPAPPGAPRKEGRADRGGLGFSEETQAPTCLSLPQNLLFVGHSPCQCS